MLEYSLAADRQRSDNGAYAYRGDKLDRGSALRRNVNDERGACGAAHNSADIAYDIGKYAAELGCVSAKRNRPFRALDFIRRHCVEYVGVAGYDCVSQHVAAYIEK